jgi:hypothetical protein
LRWRGGGEGEVEFHRCGCSGRKRRRRYGGGGGRKRKCERERGGVGRDCWRLSRFGNGRRDREGRNASGFPGVALEDGNGSELLVCVSGVARKRTARKNAHHSPLDLLADFVKLGRFDPDGLSELARRLADVFCDPVSLQSRLKSEDAGERSQSCLRNEERSAKDGRNTRRFSGPCRKTPAQPA